MSSPDMIINTPTREDYINVVTWAVNTSKYWCCGSTSIDEHQWLNHGVNMCIVFREDIISFCSASYARCFFATEIYNIEIFYKKIINNKYLMDKYNLR